MPKLNINTIISGYASVDALNSNFDAIEVAIENSLSRDGTVPNTMEADLDMNGHAILNRVADSGDANFLNRNTWIAGTTYSRNNIVYVDAGAYEGWSFIALEDHVAGGTFSTDFLAEKWQVLAQRGASGIGTGDMLNAENLSGLTDIEVARQNIDASKTEPLDSVFKIVGSVDGTKKLAFEADGITAGTVRTLTPPNYDGTIATLAGTEVFTNKTLTSPVLNTGVSGTALAVEADMETASSSTLLPTPSVIKHHPGVAKAWCYITLSGGTPTLTSGYNVASVSDVGVGNFDITFTTAFATTNYIGIGTIFASDSATSNLTIQGNSARSKTVSVFPVVIQDASGANTDTSFYLAFFGTQ
jgi:hypothetical protein